MTATREAIYSALFALVSAAYPWASTPSRRLKLWGDVPLEQRPALFQFEGEPDQYVWPSGGVAILPKRTFHAKLFAYTNAKDQGIIGATLINNILDAIDTALAPTGNDAATGKLSLGGLVDNCRIKGVPLKDCGDLDGDGLVIIDVEMILP